MKSKFYSAVMLVFLAAQAVFAGGFTSDFRVDTASQFWYRGMLAEDNLVIQPSYTLIKDAFSGTVWTNFNSITRSDDEVDLSVAYTKQLESLTVTVGAQAYFITGLYNTFDLNVLIASDKDFNLFAVYDFVNRNGFYQELSFTPKFKVEKTQLLVTAAIAANVHYMRVNSGLSHVYAQVSLPLPIGDFKVIPMMYHQQSLASDIASGTFGELSLDVSF
jgi:hypothetical protein